MDPNYKITQIQEHIFPANFPPNFSCKLFSCPEITMNETDDLMKNSSHKTPLWKLKMDREHRNQKGNVEGVDTLQAAEPPCSVSNGPIK